MPSYVGFLRAINLGAKRKFPKDAIRSCLEGAGMTDVETYINTGNVRFTTSLRSRARIEARIEECFLADRGFEVPTMVFTPSEVLDVADDATELAAGHPDALGHHITLYKRPPTAAAVAALADSSYDGEVVHVRDRAAHVLLLKNFHEAKVLNSKQFAALGVGTARNVTVIRALAEKWC
jgi:uncharacterized protein (DUF1697 family)